MKRRASRAARPALDLVEEAVHLLRTAPPGALLAYYAGAIPFAVGLLFFWADMSCGAFAQRHCSAAALGLAVLFLWLKCWQAVFASPLRARVAARAAPGWDARRVCRLVLAQGILQPSRLFVLAAAFVTAVPFAWVFAFYENVTVFGDGAPGGVRALLRRAEAQAKAWPEQNHVLLALLALAGVVLWLNAVVALLAAPQLLKMFLGTETALSRSGAAVMFNTTFLAATFCLAWLALDPLVKAVYTLRCFHGEARRDGADLLADLAFVRAGAKPIVLAALLLGAFLALSAGAAGPRPSAPTAVQPAPTVPPEQIETAVKETLQHDKYAWRLPREKVEEDSPLRAWLEGFFTGIGHWLGGWLRAAGRWLGDVLEWLGRLLFPRHRPAADDTSGKFAWSVVLRWFAFALLAAAAVALGLLVVRVWRQGWRRPQLVRAQVVPARPDLNDENATAAHLPEDDWLKLAAELLERGELRLALRAFYFATLANLAARQIVILARFKSNRDYETEVNRRARSLPELRSAFSANVSAFDRAWYGLYEVSAEGLAQFQSNLQLIRSC